MTMGSIMQRDKGDSTESDSGNFVRKRRYATRVRTGCGTCRIRRVKCDEGRPHCMNCSSTGRICEGYTAPASWGKQGSKSGTKDKVANKKDSCLRDTATVPGGPTKTTKLMIARASNPKLNLEHQPGYFGLCCLPGQTPERLMDALSRLENHTRFLEATRTLFNESIYSPLGHCYNAVVRTDQNLLLNSISLYSDATIAASRGTVLKEDSKTLASIMHGVSHSLAGQVPIYKLYRMMALVNSMCLYEIVQGGTRLAVHFSGLARMVEVAGGIANIDFGHLPRTLEATDLITSIYLGTLPLYAPVSFPNLEHQKSGGDRAEHSRPFLLTSPLYICEAFALAHKYNGNISETSVQIMQDAFNLFKIRVKSMERVTEASPITLNADTSTSDTYYADLQTALKSDMISTKSAQHFVNETIRQAAIIWWRAVARFTPFDAPGNDVNLIAIYNSMSWIPLEAWTGLPFVYLWIILIACSASTRHQRARRFFFAEMSRSSLCFGTSCLSLFAPITNNFLWFSEQIRIQQKRSSAAAGCPNPSKSVSTTRAR
ncbi:hypothetical protein EJ05DRAFT_507770 [Pseudovirgaria hyperparasitica]|uniref:Zn(2)-C6 fungal-type domain-containing protein n=1 Tax=Pseudovirgaria hyperparasitica TaxID=470096 RepID=A0A6A6WJV0_9PEZI|nr:uncharacterized protein EJ05DRAFT_507770 [Pseudovirgaria hyperparasitica]KAF2762197.1 hypothetical protein EJ05DRAFT_507770 [Pseudovirgaria hyperparasitica]